MVTPSILVLWLILQASDPGCVRHYFDQSSLLEGRPLLLFPHLAGPYWFGWIPVANHAWRQILQNGTARSDDRATPNGYAGADKNVVRQPDLIFDVYRLLLDREINPGVIVQPGAEVHAVCDSDIGTDDDFAQIVKDTVVPDPDIIPDA